MHCKITYKTSALFYGFSSVEIFNRKKILYAFDYIPIFMFEGSLEMY